MLKVPVANTLAAAAPLMAGGDVNVVSEGVTLVSRDGANIEIREEAGEDNFFLFGLSAHEVSEMKKDYRPRDIIAADDDLRAVMRLLESGFFNQFEKGLFDPIINSITSPFDPWLTAADFRSFVDAQQRVDEAYRDAERWTRMSISNVASSGKFSTDRTMQNYNEEIWKLTPLSPDSQ